MITLLPIRLSVAAAEFWVGPAACGTRAACKTSPLQQANTNTAIAITLAEKNFCTVRIHSKQ
jgi:hypothetical protein